MAFEYVKVVLYAYPHLAALAEAVGVGAENKAFLSFRGGCDTLSLAERIAEELALKNRILRLKDAIDGVLEGCGEEEMFLLEYKYFRRKAALSGRFAQMCVSCSERNYFRRQNALLRKIAAGIGMRGWTEEMYIASFGKFAPFRRALRALEKGREKSLIAHRNKREIVFGAARQKSEDSCPDVFLPRSTRTATAIAAAQRMQMTTICATLTDEPSPSGAGSVSPLPDSAVR